MEVEEGSVVALDGNFLTPTQIKRNEGKKLTIMINTTFLSLLYA